MKLRLFLIAALASLGLSTAAQAEDHIYMPKSNWVVDYGKNSCSVGREFAYENRSVILTMTRVASIDAVQIMLIGDLPRIRKSDTVNMRFMPYGDAFESDFYYGKLDDGRDALIAIGKLAPFRGTAENADKFDAEWNGNRTRLDLIAGLNGISIDPDRNAPMHFRTGSLRAIMAELDKCTDGLAQFWGLEPTKLKSLRRSAEPIGSSGGWLDDYHFPFSMLVFGKLGLVDYRLIVDETGAATDCAVTSVLGDDRFSNEICDVIMKRAKFTPALDQDGQPTKDLYVQRIVYKIEY